MSKIPYKVSGEGNNIYEMLNQHTEPGTAFFDSPFSSTGLKSTKNATIVSKKEIEKRIERLEKEIKFLKSFYE